ncbi:MAG: hypothetical protein EP313_00815 [Bacteroidetes bacterium]|nr:MAG: hypothetical protein EP313_00815 [Bacteroidota bacterium]
MGEVARSFDGPFTVADTLKGIIDYDAGSDYYTRFAETVRTITPGRIMEIFSRYFKPEEAFEIIAGSR